MRLHKSDRENRFAASRRSRSRIWSKHGRRGSKECACRICGRMCSHGNSGVNRRAASNCITGRFLCLLQSLHRSYICVGSSRKYTKSIRHTFKHLGHALVASLEIPFGRNLNLRADVIRGSDNVALETPNRAGTSFGREPYASRAFEPCLLRAKETRVRHSVSLM